MTEINYPSYDELNLQAQAELSRQRTSIDPTVFASFSRALLTGASALAYTNTLTVRDLQRQAFPQTAEGEFLELWGGYEPLPRNTATGAQGSIDLPGTNGFIPVGTLFNGSNGLVYESTASASVINNNISVSTLVRAGSIVTVTTSGAHSFATGITVTIAGADQTEYNGDFQVTVTSSTTFTYTITTTPAAATGTITASSTYAQIPVLSQTTGQTSNLSSGATLTLQSEITGAENIGYVQFGGLSGGAPVETDEAYRARIIQSRSVIEGVFTRDQVERAALTITGNTRAFVRGATMSVCDPSPGTPGFTVAPGQVAVYVLRDGDDNIVPSQIILDQTKQAIIDSGALPANTYSGDVFALGPDTVSVDFTFTSLSPDTPTMRNAITNQLRAFFQDIVQFEQNITQERYLGAIDNTVDLDTDSRITSFELSAPSGDVTVSDGEIAILGDVTFP